MYSDMQGRRVRAQVVLLRVTPHHDAAHHQALVALLLAIAAATPEATSDAGGDR